MKVLLLLVVLSFNNEVASIQWAFDSNKECEAAKKQLISTPYFQNKETRPRAYAAACTPLTLVEVKT